MLILMCHAVESEIENGNGRANDDSLNINLCEVELVISKTFSVKIEDGRKSTVKNQNVIFRFQTMTLFS